MRITETLVRQETPWALRLVPPFPSVAKRIMALAGSDDSSAEQIGKLAKTDPSFSAELLRFANSALFGASRKINGLTQAILLLGVDRVKTMASVVVMNRMVRSSVSIPTLRKVWIHSLATALIAEEAAARMRVGRDAGYTAGLLHNLGALGLMSAYPAEYSRMLEVSRDFGFDLINTERDLFEIDHCAAGAWLAKEWDFPDELVQAIAAHHEAPTAGSTGLQSLVQISWRLADELGFAAIPDHESSYEVLIAYMPAASAASWLRGDPDEARGELAARLAEAAA
jgi:putative nucleotidyltransferase with HDIG domain